MASLSLPRTRERDKKTREAAESMLNLMECSVEAAVCSDASLKIVLLRRFAGDKDKWHEGDSSLTIGVFLCVRFFFFTCAKEQEYTSGIINVCLRCSLSEAILFFLRPVADLKV